MALWEVSIELQYVVYDNTRNSDDTRLNSFVCCSPKIIAKTTGRNYYEIKPATAWDTINQARH